MCFSELWVTIECVRVCAGRPLYCTSEKKCTTPGVFWRGGAVTHTWWTVPAQEMLLCSLPGAEGPGGAQPEPRDQRELPTAYGMSMDRSGWQTLPHNTPRPITNQHSGKDGKKKKMWTQSKHGRKSLKGDGKIWNDWKREKKDGWGETVRRGRLAQIK